MSDGSDIVIRNYFKPTPSIASTQETINNNGENITINIKGRHDPAIIRRICIVVSSLMAIVLCDVLAGARGTDYLK